MTEHVQIQTIYAFVNRIGIAIEERELTDATFLPGILIEAGKLVIDRQKLLYPGDILHEAGHIAVTLPSERACLMGNVTDDRPDKSGDEIVVLLWTYAACLHIGLDVRVVFHANGYKGQSDWLIQQFTSGTYIGLPLLVWMGLADPVKAEWGFPAMKTWLRPEPNVA